MAKLKQPTPTPRKSPEPAARTPRKASLPAAGGDRFEDRSTPFPFRRPRKP